MNLFSDTERLEEVERIIRSMKAFKMPYRNQRELQIMISIAEDLRARAPGRSSDAMTKLSGLLATCERTKTRAGYAQTDLTNLALHVIGLWPEICIALKGQIETTEG